MRRLALLALIPLVVASSASAFDLQGHRGARGLAPENTLPAFARALAIGVTTLEFDTGITLDDYVVIAHDRRLNPDITRGPDDAWITSPGKLVRELSLAALKRYDVGAIRPDTAYAKSFPRQEAMPGLRMPTLRELVALTQTQGTTSVRFNIETKISPLAPAETLAPEPFAQLLIAEIRRLGIAARSSVQSFDWRTLAIVAREAPEIARVYLTIEQGRGDTIGKGKGVSPWTGLDASAHENSTPRVVHAAGGRIWSPFFRDLNAESVTDAKRLGLAIVPWTVNEPDDMRRVVGLGVDGLITDYPDRARVILAEAGITPAR